VTGVAARSLHRSRRHRRSAPRLTSCLSRTELGTREFPASTTLKMGGHLADPLAITSLLRTRDSRPVKVGAYLLQGMLRSRLIYMGGHESKRACSGLPGPRPPGNPIPPPPPTGGHAWMGFSPTHGHPDYLSGGLHKCHPGGSGCHTSKPFNDVTTPPWITKGDNPTGIELTSPPCLPHPISCRGTFWRGGG